MRKIIALILSFGFVFLPVIGNAEITNFFESMPSEDQVIVESFTKTIRGKDSLNLTRILSTKGSKDNEEYVIRTVSVDSNFKIGTYYQFDSTLICENKNVNSCKAITVSTACSQDLTSKKLSDCTVNKEKYDTKRMQKEYGSVEMAIYDMFFNTQGYKLNCRSVITKKKAEEQNIELETNTPSSLSSIIAFPFLMASVLVPYVSNFIAPATTGVTNAITNVGIGAASKATSEITGGIGSKTMNSNDTTQDNQTIPECVMQKDNQK
jgi:hypothetical protein